MSAYNVLLAKQTCLHCKQWAMQHIQFKFGNCALDKYQIGDHIKWGGNDIGERASGTARVYGVSALCENCGIGGGEFIIVVQGNVITNIIPDADEANKVRRAAIDEQYRAYKSGQLGTALDSGDSGDSGDT